jgi:uncharacterized protein YndB with AHSA1/START domain
MESGGMESVTREVVVDAPPEEVWEAVSTADRLSDWFGDGVTGDIAAGEVVRVGTDRRLLVERVEPQRRLVFRWLSDPPSRVEIEIDEVADGSRVRVVERRIEAAVSSTQRYGFRALART